MREIKLRAWDAKNKRMGKVLRMTFATCAFNDMRPVCSTAWISFGKNTYEPMEELSIEPYVDEGRWGNNGMDTCILMQYTGLKDKNGKEIFAGDILKDETTHPLEIIWCDCGWAFKWFDNGTLYKEQITTDSDDFDTQIGQFRYLEIIGNWFENSELLEDK